MSCIHVQPEPGPWLSGATPGFQCTTRIYPDENANTFKLLINFRQYTTECAVVLELALIKTTNTSLAPLSFHIQQFPPSQVFELDTTCVVFLAAQCSKSWNKIIQMYIWPCMGLSVSRSIASKMHHCIMVEVSMAFGLKKIQARVSVSHLCHLKVSKLPRGSPFWLQSTEKSIYHCGWKVWTGTLSLVYKDVH